MKRRILQMIVFVSINAVGWVALAPVRAKLGAAKLLPRSAAVAWPIGEKKLSPGLPARGGRMQLTQNVRAYANINSFTVEPGPNRQALVNASVDLGDQDAGYVYMWLIRVKSEGNATLQAFPYDQQLFNVASVRESSPTFRDIITVPQGKSWVRLTLYRFPVATDPTLFADETKAEVFSVLSASQPVEVP